MAWSSRAVALWCAVVVCARAAAYTVDCNHEYTDCDTELSKLANEEEDVPSSSATAFVTNTEIPSTTTRPTEVPTRSTPSIKDIVTDHITEATISTDVTDVTESSPKPKPRLLNLNVDELQNFANALHNQTNNKGPKKSLVDLSDVNLDGEDEDEPSRLIDHDTKHKHISDKFYSNLQAPFHPLLGVDKGSDEIETCRENGISYKIGEHIDRGCEETCECSPGGSFDCSPRCKHPYIRRGRRLNDPLCFESPVDECCSIIACATGNGDNKPTTLEVCRYGNDTYPVGGKWNIGCEQTCTCEKNSVVTCKPRCTRLPQSDKCINVQDPNDECCEVQICDVSQDAHEEPIDNATSSTTTTTTEMPPKDLEDLITVHKAPPRPLVLAEPIGSIKVLHNNSVQVNLIHVNSSEDPIHLLLSDDGGESYKDIELKYSNLILNLDGGKDYILKTRETGTKFNFTITATDAEANEVPVEDVGNTTKIGCYEDGHFYAVGEEFHIGCTELCECTGQDSRECAPLVCPNHVGLELVSKGCVRWAPTPPSQPPNCCPRSARCLSDGTCHYKGVAIPNWSEVPLSLTGCEEHCFCENGELDCQEACSPLPPLPPQNLRCPPLHRPAPVNISDEDCCKQWGCVPHAGETKGSFQEYSMPTLGEEPTVNYVTPITPILPTFTTSVLPTPPIVTDKTFFYKNLNQVKTSIPKILKTIVSAPSPNNAGSFEETHSKTIHADNITVFTPEDIDSPFKTIYPEHIMKNNENWDIDTQIHTHLHPNPPNMFKSTQTDKTLTPGLHNKKPMNIILSDSKMHDALQHAQANQPLQSNSLSPHDMFVKQMHDGVKKVSLSQLDKLHYFLPVYDKHLNNQVPFKMSEKVADPPKVTQTFFEPFVQNRSFNYLAPKPPPIPIKHENHDTINDYNRKHVTVLRHKDIKAARLNEKANDLWAQQGTKTHVLSKSPNPYETVLFRVLPVKKPENTKASRLPGKPFSPLELEHLLGQMEVESEVNRNLGRSAESHGTAAAGQLPPGFPPNAPRPPSFLPTVPPGNRYPQEDIPDYDQNNIHRPSNPLDTALAGLPPGLPIPGWGEENKKLTVLSLQSDSPTSVKMLFGLPSVLVGLRGSVDLRFTDSPDEDVSHWLSQVFAPADEVLTTPRLEFRLTGLKPSTTYRIRGKLYLHNLPVEPESDVYSIRTQDLPTLPPVEEKRREIDSKLTVVDVNDTTAHVSWRHFTEEELQFIDGIQVRYRPMGTPIYSMTELLHHSRSTAELQELRPGSRYEASLVLIPPPRATTELLDPARIEFTTSPYIDPYNWSVVLEARSVGSEAAELTWRGVPSPAERWVRVYRAAHACGESHQEHDAFRLAARDSPPTITLTGLEADAKCRVWLELFLTNGKIKTSNVLEIHTKSQDSPEPIDNVIEASSVAGSRGAPRGDYYGALVVVGVVAALAALSSALLLLVVVRRHRPRSVPITPVPSAPRDSSLPPYDNPAYKLELQQETMDL
ncbi:putative epidermal cell surface receptor isoform X2 [Epargyreus clarus]|uniref:putative epidermal cell surface receptor isoform X2 n=1 Tax=Epargyreus clarus TaxID=520877 RepID=UPI003C2CD74E